MQFIDTMQGMNTLKMFQADAQKGRIAGIE